jgi:hypothetical protein
MVLMSVVKRLRILPMGVVSKNRAGALASLWRSLRKREREAWRLA